MAEQSKTSPTNTVKPADAEKTASVAEAQKALVHEPINDGLLPTTAQADLTASSTNAASMSLFFAFDRDAVNLNHEDATNDVVLNKTGSTPTLSVEQKTHHQDENTLFSVNGASSEPYKFESDIAGAANNVSTTSEGLTGDGGRFALESAIESPSAPTQLNNEAALQGEAALSQVPSASESVGASAPSPSKGTGIDQTPPNVFAISAISDTDANADSVMENAANGTVVGVTAFASDADATDSVTYSLSDDAGGRFAIDETTGVVTVDGVIDREAAADYTIEVTATSTDGSTSTQSYTIAIGDQDEFDVTAVTDSDAGADTLAENASVGTTVGVVASASDADATDSVSYSVDDNRFTVDPDGTVRVASGASFDHETEASIDITVTATSDDGSTSNETFTLAVTDVNESGVGAISDTDANADSVMENAANGTVVGVTAFASDGDGTDSVTYSLSDDAGGRFTIDGSTGVVTVDGVIDREAAADYTIEVTATSTDGSTATQSYTITVGDEDEFDVSAVTDSDAGADTLAENASVGTTVGVVASASDADATDSVSYSVDDNRFTVDPDGTVRVASGASFDHETEASIDITVTATSTDGSTSQQTFTLAVTDVNESGVSAISDTDGSADSVMENAANGTVVGVTAFASDADATDSVTYSLSDDAGGRFAIDETTGVVTVDGVIDREAAADYTIEVTATSTDGSTSTQSYTIAIGDQDEFDVTAVTDSDAGADTLAENASVGTTVGVVASASDADATDSVSYSVDDNRFTVDPDGTVRVASGASFDHETEASIDITVTATSDDGSTSNETFTLAVTDVNESGVGAISDTDANADSVMENAANGTVVGVTAFASDGDGTDSVTYSLSDDAGGRFTIDGSTGVVTVDGVIDREAAADYTIEVTATSTDGSTATQSYTITVGDEDEFDVSAVTDSDAGADTLAENASVGTTVGVVASASDADATDSVSYSVDDNRFTVDPDGTVRVASGASFDAETEASIDITVTATSTDGSTSQETFTLSVEDNSVVLIGTNEADTLVGGDGDDLIRGNRGDDILDGGAGNDVFEVYGSSDGTDTFIGGEGYDTVRGFSTNDTIRVTDNMGNLQGIEEIDGGEGFDTLAGTANDDTIDLSSGPTLTSIERVDAGYGNDTVTGTDNDDVIRGNRGDDILDGGAGNDVFEVYGSSDGTDTFNGGEGYDTVRGFSTNDTIRVTDNMGNLQGIEEIDGGEGFDTLAGTANDDTIDLSSGPTLTSIERVDAGYGNDTVTGTDNDDVIRGNRGDDILDGGAGNDVFEVYGSSDGTDTFIGGEGYDTVRGFSTNDTIRVTDNMGNLQGIEEIDGGEGFDTLAGTANDDTIDLSSGPTLTSIERVDAGYGNDTVTGTDNDDVIRGNRGDDILDGGAGNDVFEVYGSSDGTDTFIGGEGYDTVRGFSTNDTIRVTDNMGNLQGIEEIDGGEGFDTLAGTANDDTIDLSSGPTLTSIERVDAGYGNDTVTGTDNDDVIRGNRGDDILDGGAGNDVFEVYGSSDGTDTFNGGEGYDTVRGFSTNDTIRVTDNMGNLQGIEEIDGGEGFDTLAGTANDDTIDLSSGPTLTSIERVDAGYGNDTVTGTDNDDVIRGNRGDDMLDGGAGNDVLDGGDGTDTVVYSGNRADYTITENSGIYTVVDNRAGSPDGTDTVSEFEVFRFADRDVAVDDILNANGVSTISDSDGSADSVMENAANGTVVGVTAFASDGDATDSVTYSLSDDAGGRFTIDGSTGVVTVAGAIDREAAADYTIEVTATSTDGSTATQSYTITVGDQDEFDVTAVTDSDAGADTLAEDASVGTTVGVVASASDADATDSVSYSVDDNRFTVDPDGTVRVASGASFDHETEASIDITVTATSDDGSTSQETFTLSVEDINDTAQVFTSGTSASTSEDVNYLTSLYQATVTDADSTGETITFSLVDDAGGLFEIDANSGQVTLVDGQSLDYESATSHDITIRSSDGTNTTDHTVTIDVTNVDEAPTDLVITAPQWSGASTQTIDGSNFTSTGNGFTVTGETTGGSSDSGNITSTGSGFGVAGSTGSSAPSGQLGYNAGTGISESITINFDNDISSVSFRANALWEGENGTGGEQGRWTVYKDGVQVGQSSFQSAEGGTWVDVEVNPGSDVVFDQIVFDALPYVGGQNGITNNSSDYYIDNLSYTEAGSSTMGSVAAPGAEGGSITFALTDDADGAFTINTSTGELAWAEGYTVDTSTINTDEITVEATMAGGETYSETMTITTGTESGDSIAAHATQDTIIYGLGGDDTLESGAGNDVLDGGEGSDVFVYAAGDGSDTVAGGSAGGWIDEIELQGMDGSVGVSGNTVTGQGWTMVVDGGHTIDGQNGESLTLSDDASGTITFDDGSTMTFDQIEQVSW